MPTGTKPAPKPNPHTKSEEVVVEGRPVEDDTPETAKVETETVDTDFFYPTHLDPNRKLVSTSGYLDDRDRVEAEKQRAKAEGDRKPDLKNPPATQSTPLYREGELPLGAVPKGHKADVTLPMVVVKNS